MGRKRVSNKCSLLEAKVASNALEFRELKYSRRLMTIGPDSVLWKGIVTPTSEIKGLACPNPETIKGSIVRLIPAADATDATIEATNALISSYGAAAVKVLPRQQIGQLGKGGDEASISSVSALDLRKAVHAVAGRMNSADISALKSELDSVMDEVGL